MKNILIIVLIVFAPICKILSQQKVILTKDHIFKCHKDNNYYIYLEQYFKGKKQVKESLIAGYRSENNYNNRLTSWDVFDSIVIAASVIQFSDQVRVLINKRLLDDTKNRNSAFKKVPSTFTSKPFSFIRDWNVKFSAENHVFNFYYDISDNYSDNRPLFWVIDDKNNLKIWRLNYPQIFDENEKKDVSKEWTLLDSINLENLRPKSLHVFREKNHFVLFINNKKYTYFLGQAELTMLGSIDQDLKLFLYNKDSQIVSLRDTSYLNEILVPFQNTKQ